MKVTTDDKELLAGRFAEHRARLIAMAYRMLGSLAEAEDAVQEAWLRLSRAEAAEIENLGGWLTTVVGRICLDMLRSRTARREESLQQVWLPDPIVTDGLDPEPAAVLADSVGLALLVVLDTLSPPERLAFVLHDLFGVPFSEIAPIVGRTPATAKKLASRARIRVRGAAPAPDFRHIPASCTLVWPCHRRSSPAHPRCLPQRCGQPLFPIAQKWHGLRHRDPAPILTTDHHSQFHLNCKGQHDGLSEKHQRLRPQMICFRLTCFEC